jgi:hypothetical protein
VRSAVDFASLKSPTPGYLASKNVWNVAFGIWNLAASNANLATSLND